MNTSSQSHTSSQFALLVTIIGILVVALTIALAEMTVTAHQGGGNDVIKRGDKLHDASMNGQSCTQCHQFHNNGLVEVGQTMHSDDWDNGNTWYATVFAGAGFLLGKLPERITSQEAGHSDFGENASTSQFHQPAASEVIGISNHLSRQPAMTVQARPLH
jgi:surface antigen